LWKGRGIKGARHIDARFALPPVNSLHKSKLHINTMISKPPPGAQTAIATFESDEQGAKTFASLFAECCADEDAAVSLVDNGRGRWTVAIHFRDPPDRRAVRALAAAAAGDAAAETLTFAHVAAKDWVRESLAGLPPVEAGRFVVHGAHDRARITPSRIGIEIEAALAFGTGHHGTTRGCLLALDEMCRRLGKNAPSALRPQPEVRAPRASKDAGRGVQASTLRGSPLRAEHLRVRRDGLRILDLGTGSGVLAIAAARALRQHVLATDIDPEAVRVARANARLNRAGDLVQIVRADGVDRHAIKARAPFDLIFANILLGPLQLFAAPLINLTAPGARIVLSGLLAAQVNAAIAAYNGLALERRITLEGWATLVFVRRGP
jgi:ribosomal protein L11 methyltransferase